MLVTIVAPEFILGKALADLYTAYRSKREMREFVRIDGAEWELTHGFFANMGGFVLTQKCDERGSIENQDERQVTEAASAIREDVEKGVGIVENDLIEVAPRSLRDLRIMDHDSHTLASKRSLMVMKKR